MRGNKGDKGDREEKGDIGTGFADIVLALVLVLAHLVPLSLDPMYIYRYHCVLCISTIITSLDH